MTDIQLALFGPLSVIPVPALMQEAVARGADLEVIKNENKQQLTQRLLSLGIMEQDVRRLLDQYAYGKCVTFAFWYLDELPNCEDLGLLNELQGQEVPLDISYIRNVQVALIQDYPDRVEAIFKYSKRHNYMTESDTQDEIWARFTGSVWVGKEQPYLAIIGKDEKVWSAVASYIAQALGKSFHMVRPPQRALDRILEDSVRCRITLVSPDNERTTLARTEGLSDSQRQQVQALQPQGRDVSGACRILVGEHANVTLRYNASKGSITIQKSLPVEALMQWASQTVNVILEELRNLNQERADVVFAAFGQSLDWGSLESAYHEGLTWLVNPLISPNNNEQYTENIPTSVALLFDNRELLIPSYRPHCHGCDAPVGGVCSECGAILSVEDVMRCSCPGGHRLIDGSSYRLVCSEGHRLPLWAIEHGWFIPTEKLKRIMAKNIEKVWPNSTANNRWFIANGQLVILAQGDYAREIPFESFGLCNHAEMANPEDIADAVELKEKCSRSGNRACIECIAPDGTSTCLARIFYPLIPGFHPQPHRGGEYGDIAGQFKINGQAVEVKGIMKSNNAKKDKHLSFLLSSSSSGQEIIRQLVEQGLNDARCNVIAVVVPQLVDSGFKGTLRYLCKLGGKSITFWELNEVARVIKRWKGFRQTATTA